MRPFLYFYVITAQLPNQIKPARAEIELGKVITFKCRSVVPAKWFYEKRKLSSNAISSGSDNAMTVHNVKIKNAGYYYCFGNERTSGKPFLSRTQLVIKGKTT